jgi:hypothetical protein
MSETKLSRTQNHITEGILIALGSAYIYLVTFFYEFGYCKHFGIPSTFISPNLTTILVAAAAIGSLLLSSFQIMGFSVPLIKAAANPNELQKPYRAFFALNAILLIIGLLLLTIYGPAWKVFLSFTIIVLIFNFVQFGIGLITYRKKGSLREKFEAMNNSEPDAFDFFALLMEKIGLYGYSLILFVVLTVGLAFLIGNGEATQQKIFLILKEQKEYVLLRTYGDLMIAAPIDRSKKLVEHELLLLRFTSKDKLELRSELVGPLEREPNLKPEEEPKLLN